MGSGRGLPKLIDLITTEFNGPVPVAIDNTQLAILANEFLAACIRKF